VERRTADEAPILTELSGGVDSSSIVCMSDHLRRTEKSGPDELLDTLSYYDDTEPNWNERPFFTAVETKRGKSGIHIDTAGFARVFEPAPGGYLQPGRDNNSALQDDSLRSLFEERGFRVVLSGMGGDELLGGVPTAHPELADHLVAGRFRTLLARGVDWSLPNRTPLLHLLVSTAKYCIHCYRPSALEWDRIPPWLPSSLTSRCDRLETNAIERIPTIGFRPSAVENGQTWWHIMETLPHLFLGFFHRPEYRYPYLDRDLVDFLHRVPRQELAQPGRRRAMMRRALRNIVPPEVLERRRKGFLIRKRLVSMRANKSAFDRFLADSIVLRRFSIDKGRLLWALDQTLQGQDIRWWPAIDRLVLLELWLRSRGDF
jgi:asparagine synthase (glutamine-hydrolysing)